MKKQKGMVFLLFFMMIIVAIQKEVTVMAASNNSYAEVASWRPTSLENIPDAAAANEWQTVSGTYFDGSLGATTEQRKGKEAMVRKNVIASGTENLFYVALKVRTQISWADVLDATGVWLQNGNSASSAKKEHFLTKAPTDYAYKTVYVDFVDSTGPSISGNVVYSKEFYIAQDKDFNKGNWFLYWGNPLLDNENHSYGQKQTVEEGIHYKVPIGQYMSSYDQIHHAVVAQTVTDKMGEGITYNTKGDIIYQTNGTVATQENGEINWNIHPGGTIELGTFTEFIKDSETINGKIVSTYYREYDLVYAIHLDTSNQGFQSMKTYPLNNVSEEAQLFYTYDPRVTGGEETYPYPQNPNQQLAFPVPSIKGTRYNLKFVKQDSESNQPLSGAKFVLAGEYGVGAFLNLGDIVQKEYRVEETSGEDGSIVFSNLPWGNYTLEETEAPPGYDITYQPVGYELCYTKNPANLEEDGANYCLLMSQIGNNGIISNKPWPKSLITIKKQVDNPNEIRLDGDKTQAFPISIIRSDSKQMVFCDEQGNVLAKEQVMVQLKHEQSETYMVRIKDSASFIISEDLSEIGHFSYLQTVVSTEEGAAATLQPMERTTSTVTIQPESKITLTVHNQYIPQVISAKFKKIDSEGNPLKGAIFSLYTNIKADAAIAAESISYQEQTFYKLNEISVDSTGIGEMNQLSILPPSQYILIEEKAPDGYQCIADYILFHFDPEKKLILDNPGEDVGIEAEDPVCITIINHLLYILPATGGRGIYLFTMGGVMLLMTALLLFIKERKKGEEH